MQNEEEEALLEEEAEAERLQKLAAQNLSNQDFGLPSSEEEEDDDEEDSDILEKQVLYIDDSFEEGIFLHTKLYFKIKQDKYPTCYILKTRM